MFSRAFSTRRNAATAWTCVASSRIPMPPESMLARNVPEGDFAKAVLLKKPTASSIVMRRRQRCSFFIDSRYSSQFGCSPASCR